METPLDVILRHISRSAAAGPRSYLEPLVDLSLSDLAQEVSAGLTDGSRRRQHGLSGLETQTWTSTFKYHAPRCIWSDVLDAVV